jgi:hypothetical protein
MKLKELKVGDDFVNTNAKKGTIVMRVKSHLKSGETKVSLLAYGTIGYVISDTEVTQVPADRKRLFKYDPI